MGLGYQELCKIKPDIIYVSMSGYGHTGRNHHYTSVGPVARAASGLTYLSGLPDKPLGLVLYGRHCQHVQCKTYELPARGVGAPITITITLVK